MTFTASGVTVPSSNAFCTAALSSPNASAKRQRLDPFVYLREVLARIRSTPTDQLDQFLPDVWKQKQLEEIAKG